MTALFSDEARRDPYPLYRQIRGAAPLLREPRSGLWMVFDYATAKHVLSDHESFSSKHGPDWMIFADPPRHGKLRALVSKAFTPRSVADLEPRIRDLARGLLDAAVGPGGRDDGPGGPGGEMAGRMDVATDLAVPLPMRVIAALLGLPPADHGRFVRWNDAVLNMSYAVAGAPGAGEAVRAFNAVTAEMGAYLNDLLARRRADPQDDLLTRLLAAEVDGERLTHAEILGFFQLLLLAGTETTTNLVNNAVLCLAEHPDQLAQLRRRPGLLPAAVEEVLRFRSPFQWMYRIARRDVEIHGRTVPAGHMVVAVIGSANHDPAVFPDPERFDVTRFEDGRDASPHLAFGHGGHFCLGAPLARLEARVVLGEFLGRVAEFDYAGAGPWVPRKGLHILGPERLPIRFRAAGRDGATASA